MQHADEVNHGVVVKNARLVITHTDATALNPPTGLQLVGSPTTNSCSIKWTPPAGTITGYNIYYKKQSNPTWPTTPGKTSTTTNSTISGLDLNTTYEFFVTAYITNLYGIIESVKSLTNTFTTSSPPVISGTTPICSGSQYSFSASNWVSGSYTWAKSSNLNWGTKNDITKTSIDVKANGSNAGWVRVMSGSTIMAEYPVWIGVPDPFLYLLIEGQDGLYPPGWYITNYITACPLQFIALYPKYNEPTGVLEFQGQSSNISGIKFTSPTSITFKTTKKVGEMFSFDIRYRNTCGWSSSWATIDIENVNCSKSQVLDEYKWKVYPNPTDNMLHIEQDTEAFAQSTGNMDVKAAPTFDIRLYDGQGNLLRQTNTKGATVQFNVSNLTDGLYYLHIYDGVSSTPEIHQIMVEH